MITVSYSDYQSLGGRAVRSGEEFDALCRRAFALLRGAGAVLPEEPGTEEAEAITLCVCEICDVLSGSVERSGILSESVDGWSRTFAVKGESGVQGEIIGIIYRRLSRFGFAPRRAVAVW